MTDNVVSVSEVRIGDRHSRRGGSAYDIDPRGQDIPIFWTATGPRGYGFSQQPYSASQYGGALPPDFIGWDVEVWMYRNGSAVTGSLACVAKYSVPPRQLSFVFTEEANCACAARFGLGFQTSVKFVVWPVTLRGRGGSATVTSSVGSAGGTSWAIGSPKTSQRKWFSRCVLIQPDVRDAVQLTIRRALAAQTSHFLDFVDDHEDVLSYFDSTGKFSSIQKIADVSSTAPTNGQVLAFNTVTSLWTPVSAGSGSGFQAWDADLDTLAGLAKTSGNLIVANGSIWTSVAPGASSGVQAYDADLDTIAGLSNASGNFIVGTGSAWAAQSGSTARTSIGLGTGDSPTFTAVTTSGGIACSGTLTVDNIREKTAAAGVTFFDSQLIIVDDGATTKKAAFDSSAITAGTTRTFTFPNFSGTFFCTAGTQTATGAKTFTGGMTITTTALSCTSAATFSGGVTINTTALTCNPAARFNGAVTIAASQTVSVNSDIVMKYQRTMAGVKFEDSNGTPKTVQLVGPVTLTNTWSLTLPVDVPGSTGQALVSTAGGIASWSPRGTYPVLTGKTTDYAIAATDVYVGFDTTAARTPTLPTVANAGVGHQIVVKDETGSAASNNITITRSSSDTIDGATTKVISTNYGYARLIAYAAGKWASIGSGAS